MELNQKEIKQLERKYRLNLVNSITGIKPANLVATRSKEGLNNVAIFSSVVHLGSNPAQLGLIMRPQGETRRDTMLNIQETGIYTINHVSDSFIKKAHYTSAKLDRKESEFEVMKLTPEFKFDFKVPFVKECFVQLGMKHLESIPLPNGCTLIIGSVVHISVPDDAVNELGQIDLTEYGCVGISGLNTYYSFKKLETFPYVRTSEIPDFN